MPLELIAVEIADDALRMHPATLAVCSCGSRHFLVFQVAGHTPPHLQCAACGEVYCTGREEEH